ncbi:MAG: ABC transporter permease [Candidatus Hodarchaeota archaeon]
MENRDHKPSRFAWWILEKLSVYSDRYLIKEDLEEEYLSLCQTQGKRKARRWLWRQTLLAVGFYVKYLSSWRNLMLKNYLKITFRNIKRHKAFSFISMAGLIVGMTCFILILLFIRYELSYDMFHENADNIYRVYVESPNEHFGSSSYAGSPGIMAQTLMDELPEVVNATKIGKYTNRLIQYGDKKFYENGIFAERNFLDIFTFPLIRGDREKALNDPFSIIISETLVEKLFQNENPIGKILNIDGRFDFKITGIHKNVPSNSHLQFFFVVSFATLLANAERRDSIHEWDAHMYYTYIVLPEDSRFKEVEEKIAVVANKYARDTMEEDGTIFRLQPLKKIHLQSKFNNEIAVNNNDIKYIYFYAVIGFVILAIACINNVNLTTARASKRAKEIGIRKICGSKKKQLFTQFISESIVLSIIGLSIALIAVGFVFPEFKSFINRDIEIDLFQNIDLMALVVGIVLFTGLLSGSYPALFLSSFQPVKVLKGNYNSSSKSAKFRNILVITQFSVSIILIAVTLIIFKQLKFMTTADAGYEKDHIIVLRVRDREARQQYSVIKNRLLQHKNVTSVTSSSYLPSGILTQRTPIIKLDTGKKVKIPICRARVDYNYLDFFQIKLTEGRNFSKEFSTDEKDAVIINETAVERFGWKEPLGKDFHDYGKVIGVVKDFHFLSFHHEIKPLALTLSPKNNYFISVKIQSKQIPKTIAYINQVFVEFSPNHPLNYEFFDELYYEQYQAEQQLGSLFGYFSGLSLFIACFGLFGLALFEAERKTKEIGIRKTLGASVLNIVILLSKDYMRLIVISNLIAWPVAFYFMYEWLKNFAYRINLGLGIFVVSAVLAFFIALLTISFQTIRTATANPVESLRYE